MIRRATEDDLLAIFALLCANVSPPWSEASLLAAFKNPNNDFFVWDDGDIRGYICVENVIDEGCLSSIAVDKAYRRRGIAELLVRHAIDSSKMLTHYLEVEETNAAATALYEKCGFKRIATRKKYYGEQSAIIMRRE